MGVDPSQVAWKDFLGNAPDQPFDEYRFRNWRWFWDFGGGLLTDLMVHWIDVAHWFLDVDHPVKATTIGNHFASKGALADARHDPVHPGVPEQRPGPLRGDVLQRDLRRDDHVHGDRRDALHRPRPVRAHPRARQGEARVVDPREQSRSKGADFYDKPDGELLHLTNWVECVRSRQRPNAPAEAGVGAAAAAHLGNRAYRSGDVAIWTTG